ncbi:MAG: hypothetical protein IIA49_16170 [Bacteroidetes bacterium]|nr:hypothetical protein [Bacteroidota bacterium]
MEHSIFKTQDFQYLLRGEISEDEYWDRIIKNSGLNIDADSLKKARRNSFKEIGKVTTDDNFSVKGSDGKTIVNTTLKGMGDAYEETFKGF